MQIIVLLSRLIAENTFELYFSHNLLLIEGYLCLHTLAFFKLVDVLSIILVMTLFILKYQLCLYSSVVN